MGCCSVSKRRGRLLVLPALLLVLIAVAGGAVGAVLSLASLAVPAWADRRRRFWSGFLSLERALARRLLDDPFLFNSTVRARWSGRLMRRSPSLGGWVYRYFNVVVLLLLLPLGGAAGMVVYGILH